MTRFAQALTASLLLVVAAACGRDSTSEQTQAIAVKGMASDAAVGNPAPPPPPMATAPEMAARRDMAEQSGFAATGAAMGSAGQDGAPGRDPLQGIGQFNTGTQSMLIRTGQAFIEVESLDPAVLKVRQLAAQVNGMIANSSIIGEIGRASCRESVQHTMGARSDGIA